MALTSVSLVGEIILPCKYAARSEDFLSVLTIMFMFNDEGGDADAMGISHSPPPDVLLVPCNTVLPFFVAINFSFVRCTLHPLSHSCPRNIKLWFRFLNTFVLVAVGCRSDMGI